MQTKMTKEQKVWCKKYQKATDFEPLIEDFLAGNESFVDAAKKSSHWFEDYCTDAQRGIPDIPGDD